ncbi:hypothetical protein ACLMJK_006424 [Lecanora helva]
MGDPLSVAASIVGIATAGIQVSIKIVTLVGQVSTASDRISALGNDISLTSGILHQLGELTNQKTASGDTFIFNKEGLATTKSSAEVCQRIFREVEKEVAKASDLIRGRKHRVGEKVKLSIVEKAKWPFLQPGLELLRTDLREAKGTLMLMLQVLHDSFLYNCHTAKCLGREFGPLPADDQANGWFVWLPSMLMRIKCITHGLSFLSTMSTSLEQEDMIRSIYILQQQQNSLGKQNPRSTLQSETNITEDFDPEDVGENVNPSAVSMQSKEPPISPSSPLAVGQPPAAAKDNKDTYRAKRPANPQYNAEGAPSTDRDSIQSSSHDSNKPNATIAVNHSEEVLLTDYSSRDEVRKPDSEAAEDIQLAFWCFDPELNTIERGFEVVWCYQKLPISEGEIRETLARDQAHGRLSVADTIANLHAFERSILNSFTERKSAKHDVSLIFLKRTEQDLRHGNIKLKSVPSFHLIIQAISRRKRHKLGENIREKLSDGSQNRIESISLSRPTWIKVNHKHICPETLDMYALPWGWDESKTDTDYIMIKQWVPEAQQNDLFEHTRRLRERKQTADSTIELKKERDQLLLVRRSSRRGRTVESDSDLQSHHSPVFPEYERQRRVATSQTSARSSGSRATGDMNPLFLIEREKKHSRASPELTPEEIKLPGQRAYDENSDNDGGDVFEEPEDEEEPAAMEDPEDVEESEDEEEAEEEEGPEEGLMEQHPAPQLNYVERGDLSTLPANEVSDEIGAVTDLLQKYTTVFDSSVMPASAQAKTSERRRSRSRPWLLT